MFYRKLAVVPQEVDMCNTGHWHVYYRKWAVVLQEVDMCYIGSGHVL